MQGAFWGFVVSCYVSGGGLCRGRFQSLWMFHRQLRLRCLGRLILCYGAVEAE